MIFIVFDKPVFEAQSARPCRSLDTLVTPQWSNIEANSPDHVPLGHAEEKPDPLPFLIAFESYYKDIHALQRCQFLPCGLQTPDGTRLYPHSSVFAASCVRHCGIIKLRDKSAGKCQKSGCPAGVLVGFSAHSGIKASEVVNCQTIDNCFWIVYGVACCMRADNRDGFKMTLTQKQCLNSGQNLTTLFWKLLKQKH